MYLQLIPLWHQPTNYDTPLLPLVHQIHWNSSLLQIWSLCVSWVLVTGSSGLQEDLFHLTRGHGVHRNCNPRLGAQSVVIPLVGGTTGFKSCTATCALSTFQDSEKFPDVKLTACSEHTAFTTSASFHLSLSPCPQLFRLLLLSVYLTVM